MQWPDEASNATEESSQQLEKVIGYSDGGEFASRVGPQPIGSSDGSGRFADLVQSRIVSKKDKEKQQQEHGQEQEGAGTNAFAYASQGSVCQTSKFPYMLHHSINRAFNPPQFCSDSLILTCLDALDVSMKPHMACLLLRLAL